MDIYWELIFVCTFENCLHQGQEHICLTGGNLGGRVGGADSGAVWDPCKHKKNPEIHRWDLPVLHYHKIMVIYPYPFLNGNYPIVLLDNIY